MGNVRRIDAGPDSSCTPRPVPRLSFRENLAGVRAMRRDQLAFLQRSRKTHGDIFRMRLGGLPMVVLTNPDHVHHVLVDRHTNYDKENFLYRTVRAILREGLIGNPGGATWSRNRRLMQPTFNHASVARFAPNMTGQTAELLRAWPPRAASGAVVDVVPPLADLALKIVLRSLFGVDPDARSRKFERDFLEVNRRLGDFLRFPFPPLHWRTPARDRLRFLTREMDGFVSYLFQVRQGRTEQADGHRSGPQQQDLFTLLVRAVDAETGTGLTPTQLANEVLAMIIAGYETTSNSIAWVFYQLARHPEVQHRVHDEVDDVLGGRMPAFDDLPRLPYSRMVVDETLRMFTPAWQTMRRAVDDDVIDGYHIPGGTELHLNMFLLHRHPDFWPAPDRFDPDRFTPEAVAARPRHAYQPFGSGPRYCIGKHFALAELHLILVMLAQTFSVTLPAADQPPVGFAPLVTLHPKGGLHLRLYRR
ncbi:cytochrome P450 [Solwaraspora sp. WMMB335]|uniref:cytochrome P450 n=1 Tax=Solwaraspora sp. WMMB335 TaxID=3404118 RepID=UPI003B93536B